jgi:hypothetical protein
MQELILLRQMQQRLASQLTGTTDSSFSKRSVKEYGTCSTLRDPTSVLQPPRDY